MSSRVEKAPFAHLIAGAAAKKAEPEEDKKKASAESEEDTSDEDKKDEKDDKKDAKKAKSKSKKANADDGEDDGEDDANDEDMKRAGAQEERARCAAIFADPAAGRRPDVAASLAFETDLSASQAIKVLRTTAQGAPETPAPRAAIGARMQDVKNFTIGGDTPAGGEAPKPGTAAFLLAAGKMRRGEPLTQRG
jgi:hypothetical protein